MSDITPEVIEALAYLRRMWNLDATAKQRFDVLDNAGIFAAIDEASDYDTDTEPVRVRECTCHVRGFLDKSGPHAPGCGG